MSAQRSETPISTLGERSHVRTASERAHFAEILPLNGLITIIGRICCRKLARVSVCRSDLLILFQGEVKQAVAYRAVLIEWLQSPGAASRHQCARHLFRADGGFQQSRTQRPRERVR